MSLTEISDVTGLTLLQQRKALAEIIAIGWMEQRGSTLYVARFEEKALPPKDRTGAERQRRLRNTRNGVTPVTVTALEEEGEVDTDTPPVVPLSSEATPVDAAKAFCAWYIAAAQSMEFLQAVYDPAHWAADAGRIQTAMRLLRTYGRENCEARALALFRAVTTKRLQRASAELRDLERCWDYDAVVAALGDMQSPAEIEDDLTRRLRLAEAKNA